MARQDDYDARERMAKIRESLIKMFKATAVYDELLDSFGKQIIDTMSPFLTLQEEVASRFKKLTEFIRSSPLIESLENLRVTLAQVAAILKEYDRALGVLVELGWPPHGDLDTSDLASIVRIYDSEGPERAAPIVDQYMIKRYGETELNSILERWRQRRWLRSRMPILEQIIEGHKQALYYLIVPACLPQIEGVVAEGFGHTGRMKKEDYERYLEKLLDTPLSGDKAMQEFMSDVVLAHFVWGMQLSSQFSRHAILHGIDTKYGTAQNSLRSILLFDYIQGKFGYVSVDGQLYHDPVCPIIRGKARLAIFQWEAQAVRAGMRPCSQCISEGESSIVERTA